MTVAATNDWVTTEQLLAMPEDGKDRWLIEGELREADMTRRNRGHSRVEVQIAHYIALWNESRPEPRGEVLGGEAGIRLAKNPDTTVGVDVAYVSAEVAAASPPDDPYLDGVPVLIVEVLSRSDKHEEILEKVSIYLKAGVQRVWIADPDFKTITVHRPDGQPELFNINQTLEAGEVMPGLRISLRDVFGK